MDYYKILNIAQLLCSRTLLFISFICSSLYLLSQTPSLPLPLSSLDDHKVVFYVCWVCFYFVNKSIFVIFLDSAYKWYHTICLSLSDLFHLVWIIHRFFFLWLSSIPLYVCGIFIPSSLFIHLLIKICFCVLAIKYCCKEHWNTCIFTN